MDLWRVVRSGKHSRIGGARGRPVIALAALAMVAVALLAPATALAHGGGTPQLVDVPAGPYRIFAWTSPATPRVGTLHVTVALVDPAANQPVLGADVQVQMSPGAGQPAAVNTSPATHDKATIKFYYEADVEVPEAGPWQVSIAYRSPQGAGQAGFDLAVKEKAFGGWPLFGAAAVALLAAGWLLWPATRRAADRERRTADIEGRQTLDPSETSL